MTGYNTTQNRKITSRAIIGAIALAAFAFSGMAAAEQFYVNEGGWWRDGFSGDRTPHITKNHSYKSDNPSSKYFMAYL